MLDEICPMAQFVLRWGSFRCGRLFLKVHHCLWALNKFGTLSMFLDRTEPSLEKIIILLELSEPHFIVRSCVCSILYRWWMFTTSVLINQLFCRSFFTLGDKTSAVRPIPKPRGLLMSYCCTPRVQNYICLFQVLFKTHVVSAIGSFFSLFLCRSID